MRGLSSFKYRYLQTSGASSRPLCCWSKVFRLVYFAKAALTIKSEGAFPYLSSSCFASLFQSVLALVLLFVHVPAPIPEMVQA